MTFLGRTSIITLLFLASNVDAMETDPFTCRYSPRRDSADPINAVFAEALEHARLAAEIQTESDRTSSPEPLAKLFRKKFRDRFPGHSQTFGSVLKIESWMENVLAPQGYATHPTLSGRPFHIFDETIPYYYSGRGGVNAVVFHTVQVLLNYESANTFNVGNVLIGSDKIGHFIDQGFDYWEKSKGGTDLAAAIRYGTETELGFFGMKTTGVFSYSDLAANWAGFDFYLNLVATESDPFEKRAQAYYLIRSNSKGELRIVPQRKFEISKYVTQDWDEAINPSAFSESVADMVNAHFSHHACRVCQDYWNFKGERPTESLLPKELYVDLSPTHEMIPHHLFNLENFCSDLKGRCPVLPDPEFTCFDYPKDTGQTNQTL